MGVLEKNAAALETGDSGRRRKGRERRVGERDWSVRRITEEGIRICV